MSVYVIHAVGTGFVKIGVAEDVQSRLRTLATGCPYELRLVATIEADRAFEKKLHGQLRPERIRGEWFRVGPATRSILYRVFGLSWRDLHTMAWRPKRGGKAGRKPGPLNRVICVQDRGGGGRKRFRVHYTVEGVRKVSGYASREEADAAAMGMIEAAIRPTPSN